jgi:formate dehydrogenase major subunit
MRARVSEKIAVGVVYTTFHFPETNANVVTTENSDWATNCPEYKVTAVEVVLVNQKDAWQKRTAEERSQPRPRKRKHDPAPA